MIYNELWRYISLFLDKPHYIYCVNKSLNTLKNTSYVWILPQYLKNQLIGADCETSELKGLYNWYNTPYEINAKLHIIKDLAYIIESCYIDNRRYITRRLYKQRIKINVQKLKLIINHNINMFDTDNNNEKTFLNCKVHKTYRLPPIIMRYMKKQGGMLQVKALIF